MYGSKTKNIIELHWIEAFDLGYVKYSLKSQAIAIKLSFFLIQHIPHLWCAGTASVSDAGGHGFDPRPGHTKEFKKASNGRLPWHC